MASCLLSTVSFVSISVVVDGLYRVFSKFGSLNIDVFLLFAVKIVIKGDRNTGMLDTCNTCNTYNACNTCNTYNAYNTYNTYNAYKKSNACNAYNTYNTHNTCYKCT